MLIYVEHRIHHGYPRRQTPAPSPSPVPWTFEPRTPEHHGGIPVVSNEYINDHDWKPHAGNEHLLVCGYCNATLSKAELIRRIGVATYIQCIDNTYVARSPQSLAPSQGDEQ